MFQRIIPNQSGLFGLHMAVGNLSHQVWNNWSDMKRHHQGPRIQTSPLDGLETSWNWIGPILDSFQELRGFNLPQKMAVGKNTKSVSLCLNLAHLAQPREFSAEVSRPPRPSARLGYSPAPRATGKAWEPLPLAIPMTLRRHCSIHLSVNLIHCVSCVHLEDLKFMLEREISVVQQAMSPAHHKGTIKKTLLSFLVQKERL